MKINCPSCEEQTVIEVTVSCEKCNKPLNKFTFEKARKVSVAWLCAATAAGTFYVDAKYIESERYPLATEYALVDQCIFGNSVNISRSDLDKKKKVCSCAIAETISDIDFDEYKKEPRAFARLLDSNVRRCT
ncbi:hypothetical protein [uncultured Ferrimonas sp.]|uniref:hypothetical protein n=1 Tax=uncultured Ferrimonas sp. TaxID=432640 RepID=UPI00263944CE|nr:hypothetical protein [uncultured Ferrimonas sp.]